MPLVHFGDTSYEKYIFGGQGKPPAQEISNKTALLAEKPAIEEFGKKYDPAELDLKRERWNSPEKVRENGVSMKEDRNSYDDGRILDHKLRGAHTTTVNFLNDENSAVAVQPKVVEGIRELCFVITIRYDSTWKIVFLMPCGILTSFRSNTLLSF